jgi:hypothetical protein
VLSPDRRRVQLFPPFAQCALRRRESLSLRAWTRLVLELRGLSEDI